VAEAVATEAAATDAADAGDTARQTVEGVHTPDDAGESAVVEAAAADLGAPPPAATGEAEGTGAEAAGEQAASPAENKPAEPEFDEVWFPAGRRPDNPRHDNANRRGPRRENAPADAATGDRPPRKFHRPEGGGGKPKDRSRDGGKPFEAGGKPGGKPGGKRFDRPKDDWKEHRPREDRKPAAIDPNSPWAALAALRNPKSD
jgi:ATP-dependent RNA helicase SUPV3L1/SUV3